ncbi:MAG: LPXTG cell wall anchor domain-containing protein [Saprospiraceae bacterium]|nr:LPXTG cell wall anchor domain-containing protein [Saprospiraceae bacterium]
MHISQGQSPYRIDFVDSLGVVFSVKKNDNSPYKFSAEDLIAAGLVGQVTIKTHDADDITDQVVPTKINLPALPDHSFWYFLFIAIFSILFLLLFLLFWRRRKNKKRMTGYAYP